MLTSDLELEVKFLLQDLGEIEKRITQEGGQLIQPRTFENNLRFDTPAGTLGQEKKILRLRQDRTARLTFKGAGQLVGGISQRQEIEFEVADFQAARRFLQALGYQVHLIYEKYRTVYVLALAAGSVSLMLDETPLGNFLEIEGPEAEVIQIWVGRLGLDWNCRITDSYGQLFDRLQAARQDTPEHLTFKAFQSLNVSPQELGLRPAD